MQSHDPTKPEGCEVGQVSSATFLFPISYCSLASSLGAGPGAQLGRELHGTETVVSRCLYCTVPQSLTQQFTSPTDRTALLIQAVVTIQY